MDVYTFEFNIRANKVVNNCNLYPTSTNKSDSKWLCAANNKYADESVDPDKVGQWMIFLPKNCVNATWDKIKKGVTSGELWQAKVSTCDPAESEDFHAFFIRTKDYTDVDDVIRVLDYLESSGIKPPNANIKYSQSEQTVADCGSENNERSWIYSSNLIRTVGDSVQHRYEYDIYKNELVTDSKLYPMETLKSDFEYLYAENNKYSEETIDCEKMGKWMLFLPEDRVDSTWDKIKIAVAEGDLWRSKASTVDPEKFGKIPIIKVYTKDYRDLNDVISVLDYLERSGMKPPDLELKYKTNQLTRAGIFRGGRGKPWMYSSETIRTLDSTQPLDESIRYTYHFDIEKKELVTNCNLCPTDVFEISPWLLAKNNKYIDEEVDRRKVGKWMIFFSKHRVNAAWDKVKQAVANGKLWSSKVSTSTPENSSNTCHVIMIYTKDYTDVKDVISVLDYIESSGIKPPQVAVKYKTDEQSRAVTRHGPGQNRWMYSSDTIRTIELTQSFDNSISYAYKVDIHRKKVVSDCDLNPTEVSERISWLYAKNNKYADDTIDFGKVGKWTLFLPECRVNSAWNKIKVAVANGELWFAKVSTSYENSSPYDSYSAIIYTKDYTDLNDVICSLNYLERSQIKPANVNIKYKTEQQTFKLESWTYSSDTIRSLDNVSNNKLSRLNHKFDICDKKSTSNHNLSPTRTLNRPPWFCARNNKYPEQIIDPEKMGKWLLFLKKESFDAAWKKIKVAVASGELWFVESEVSLFKRKNYSLGDTYTVLVYTKDWTDLKGVIQVLDYLERSGIKPPSVNITYQTDDQNFTCHRADVYHAGGPKPLYFSRTIRSDFKIDLA